LPSAIANAIAAVPRFIFPAHLVNRELAVNFKRSLPGLTGMICKNTLLCDLINAFLHLLHSKGLVNVEQVPLLRLDPSLAGISLALGM
jgi:hypothetical protein